MHLTIDFGPLWFWLVFYLVLALVVLLVIFFNSKGRK